MPTLGDPQYQSNWHTLDKHDHQPGTITTTGTTTVNHNHTIGSGYLPGGSIYSGSQPQPNYQWNYGQWQQTPVELPPQTPDEVEAKIEELRLQMEALEETYREMIRVERGIVTHECAN